MPGGPGGPGGMLGGGAQDTEAAYAYAIAHQPASVVLVVSSQESAAASILQGRSIAGMGGFTGTETVLTPDFLARAVADGTVRYVLLGGQSGGFGRFGRGANAGEQTVERSCRQVPASAWSSNGQTLYDCGGRSAAIAAAGS